MRASALSNYRCKITTEPGSLKFLIKMLIIMIIFSLSLFFNSPNNVQIMFQTWNITIFMCRITCSYIIFQILRKSRRNHILGSVALLWYLVKCEILFYTGPSLAGAQGVQPRPYILRGMRGNFWFVEFPKIFISKRFFSRPYI